MTTEAKINPDHAKKHTMSFEDAIKALDEVEQKLSSAPAAAPGADAAGLKIPDLCAFWAQGHQVLDIVKTLLFWRPKCQAWVGNLISSLDATCKTNPPA